jgi:hypothetical protein
MMWKPSVNAIWLLAASSVEASTTTGAQLSVDARFMAATRFPR